LNPDFTLEFQLGPYIWVPAGTIWFPWDGEKVAMNTAQPSGDRYVRIDHAGRSYEEYLAMQPFDPIYWGLMVEAGWPTDEKAISAACSGEGAVAGVR